MAGIVNWDKWAEPWTAKAYSKAKGGSEKSKARLSFNFFAFFLAFSLLFSCFLFIVHGYILACLSLLNAAGLAIALLDLRKYGSLSRASKIFSFSSYLYTTLYVLLSPLEISVLNAMWFILIGIFVYLNLGPKWGKGFFALIMLTFNPLAYLKFTGFNKYSDPGISGLSYRLSILIVLAAAFAFLVYIIKEFIDARETAQKNLTKAYKKLHQRQVQMGAILAAVPDRIFRTKNDTIQSFNFDKETGELNVSVLEHSPLPPGAVEKSTEMTRLAIETGELQTFELGFDYEGNHLEFEARIIKSGPDEAISIVRDITTRKEAELALQENQHFIERILNTNPNIIWIHDLEQQKTVFANNELSTRLGYTLDEIQEKGTKMLLYPVDYTHFSSFLHNTVLHLRDGENAELEYRIIAADGNVRWMLGRFAVFARNEKGEVKQYLGTSQDITQRKLMEQQLIAEKERAELASQAKEQFLSTMSHEIRTPLNAVVGFTHILLQENPREDQLNYLQTLQFSANHLLALINDILDFSKIEAGRIDFESAEFDLEDLLNSILKSFSLRASEKGIALELSHKGLPMHKLIGDPLRLGQVLTNLVGNAVKFTEKGKVTLGYKLRTVGDTLWADFSVRDTGIGIPEDKLEKIFESFSQATASTSRQYGGTGLGLAISKRLIELQGGSMHVESQLGAWSEFTFSIPFRQGEAITHKGAPTTDKAVRSLEGMCILLAEDNPINVMVASKFLSKWNAKVDVAPDGKQALAMAQTQHYDLILMDIHMPEMNGYEATANIRKLEGSYYQKLPIVALTASASLNVKDDVRDKGMNDYLTKPFNPDDLYFMVAKYHPHGKATYMKTA